MISYLFNNNKRIDNKKLLNILKNDFNLDYILHSKNNVVLGDTNIVVDIDSKYISILLYNEQLNIKPIKKYILEKTYGKNKQYY